MSKTFPTQFVTAAGLKPRDIKAGALGGLYVTRTVGGKSKPFYLTGASAEQRRLNPDVYDVRGAVRTDLRDHIYSMTRNKACGRASGTFPRAAGPSPSPSTSAPPNLDSKRAQAAEEAAARCEERASDLSRRLDTAKRANADAESREAELARRAAAAETSASRCATRETELEGDVTRLRDTVQTLEETKRELNSELGVQRVEIGVQRATLDDLQRRIREGQAAFGAQFAFGLAQSAAHQREVARLVAEREGLQRQLALVVASERSPVSTTTTPPPRAAPRSSPTAVATGSPTRSSPAARAILARIDTIDDRIDQLAAEDADEAAQLATRDTGGRRRGSPPRLAPVPSSSPTLRR